MWNVGIFNEIRFVMENNTGFMTVLVLIDYYD